MDVRLCVFVRVWVPRPPLILPLLLLPTAATTATDAATIVANIVAVDSDAAAAAVGDAPIVYVCTS